MAMRQSAMTTPLKSHKVQNIGPNLPEGANQITSHSSKPTFATGLDMQQTVSYGANALQVYVEPICCGRSWLYLQ